MKHVANRWLLLFVLLLGMSAMACSLPFGGEEEPTPRPTRDSDDEDNADSAEDAVVEEDAPEAEPTAAVEAESADPVEEVIEEATAVPAAPEETETADDGGLFSGLFAQSVNVSETVQELDDLNSYQMQMEISTTYSETTQLIQASIIVSTDPPQSSMTFIFEGLGDMAGMDSMSMTQIEGTSYMEVPGLGCITTTEGDMMGEDFADSMAASQFMEEVGEAELVGEETINGIDTLHYTFDETALQNEMSELNWAQGDVYIAKEGNYVVRFRMEGEGNVSDALMALDQGDTMTEARIGQMVIQMDISNINEPVNITIPEACENSGAGNSEYPILEDAAEYSSFGSFVTYTTETAFADIVTFYQENLAAQGWVYDEGESLILENSTALMYFTLDERTLTVTVTEISGSSSFTVLLLEE
ncbi:MAG: hypothetical protein H6652_16195 [Ardenticatenaceae bacterium]|nr:hypothetical protein [Ardenticatenaceae bacterium]